MNFESIIIFLINFIENPIMAFVGGAFFSAFVTYLFNAKSERQKIKENLNFSLASDLNKKIYDCLKCSTSIFINAINTNLNCYKMEIINLKNIKEVITTYNYSDKEYEAGNKLLKEKKLLLDKINNLQNFICDIILYIETNYIALNKFEDFRIELMKLSKSINYEQDKLIQLLYFESNDWEDNLDDKKLKNIENKVNKINNNFEEIKIKIMAYLSDFQIAIQNEYYSKYYNRGLLKYKLMYRNPTDGIVIKPKKSKNRSLDFYNIEI